ncbi:tRNA (cytosine(32)/uridine(32)-2'-O)-methyltransferase TrmJ [Cellvibrio japonicus]|uniref:tRNA (cytidine/uridine-2'-O-)-methyltransferase TrmJ n=1 Tax=Cellvibrio japonicus (strain Ueda107) TaxID=498211 RepID=B3PDK4_CELJU|nr:tRNA (cytosine(32)/uridine(32)-2'-O)-methyltransferase TrmJ [Cellvibrio japonicus]ACE84507.1 RNA methyltransferase, TrmH family, group 1 [Cellvibrio japonicus Ueda107]QEI12017.1 tRNA (cytosine(32)/uridine(32)-2'-O)-methyltransferase TrmJ [Cellvibrio japonicus]QEI15592.1 tRNA (cytosine(32)/uridine(32)-2'-O)-methyltransferase TrmJ [Cellvibrio japonicus]QEI19170.1 tRNA (cytosine(32)/uridine(32)-2'-O)-methyltransferase TrmJ [Cellvibrio japonicus]
MSNAANAPFANIRIVLVNTSHPGNIGGAARAMKNMGLDRLYLVAPKEYPSDKAVWRAAGATDVLDNAVVVETLDEAIAGCSLVVGTSARERRIPWPLLDPRQCGESIWAEAGEHEVAVVFGREDRGLTNEELHKCTYHVHIPANAEYSSLNLATAVQVICYEIRMAYLQAVEGKSLPNHHWDMPPADAGALENYYQHLEQALVDLGFLDPDNPKQTMTRLRRLYNRVRLDQMELNILRGVLTAMQNYVYYTGKVVSQQGLAADIESLRSAAKALDVAPTEVDIPRE